MFKPRKRRKPSPAASPSKEPEVVDLATQRRLRRDLKLSSGDLAEIDLALAIEAGLIKKPDRS